jgi:hypothetical protein
MCFHVNPIRLGPLDIVSLNRCASEMLKTSYEEEHKIAAVDSIAVPARSEKFRNISSQVSVSVSNSVS